MGGLINHCDVLLWVFLIASDICCCIVGSSRLKVLYTAFCGQAGRQYRILVYVILCVKVLLHEQRSRQVGKQQGIIVVFSFIYCHCVRRLRVCY